MVLGRAEAQGAESFRKFLEGVWKEAEALGVSRATFDLAFRGVEPDLSLPDLVLPGKTEVRGQAEFTKTPAEYLSTTRLESLAAQGRTLMVRHRQELEQIEREIGVQRQVVLAIWGRETAYGSHRSSHYAIRALATQAYLGRRKEMFRVELMHALKMLEEGVLSREAMNSSWAGAMGLTQFMPSEYFTVAYDLDRDGRKDIWHSVPDSLASAANQLREKGWVPGQTWGYEVRFPKGVACLQEGPQHARPLREWIERGAAWVAGRGFPAEALDAQAFILTPGGAHGPTFLVLENFLVIKRYNMSDLYALFVGNLADRIAGGGGFAVPWGKVTQLSAKGIEEIQTHLQTLGHPIAKIDGKAGMNTRSLIGAYQQASGLKVDCWPSEAMRRHLRTSVAAARKAADSAEAKSGLGTR
jgi:lytic murein transglycosylase